jgi:hypothetical protein
MFKSKRKKNKILLSSYVCKLLGIMNEQELETILNQFQSKESPN